MTPNIWFVATNRNYCRKRGNATSVVCIVCEMCFKSFSFVYCSCVCFRRMWEQLKRRSSYQALPTIEPKKSIDLFRDLHHPIFQNIRIVHVSATHLAAFVDFSHSHLNHSHPIFFIYFSHIPEWYESSPFQYNSNTNNYHVKQIDNATCAASMLEIHLFRSHWYGMQQFKGKFYLLLK